MPQHISSQRTDQAWKDGVENKDKEVLADLWVELFVRAQNLVRIGRAQEDDASEGTISANGRIIKNIQQYNFRAPFLIYCSKILANEISRAATKRRNYNRRMYPLPDDDGSN